jgi:ABC-type transport system involved in multi-copper enzyme maturation permease subunit
MRKGITALIALVRALAESPMLVKELRVALRGWRAPAMVAAAVGLGSVACVGLLAFFWPHRVNPDEAAVVYPLVGRKVFAGLMMLEGVVCTLVLPALTAGAFAGERQQGMLDSLFLTRLTNADIVLGKLLAALAFVALLLLGNLPVVAIVSLLGGVTPGDILWALLLLADAVAVQLALGLYLSLRAPTTVIAAGLTFGRYELFCG